MQVELRIESSIALIRQKLAETRNRVDILTASPVINELLLVKTGIEEDRSEAARRFVNKIAKQDPYILDISVVNSSGESVIRTMTQYGNDHSLLENQEKLFQRVQTTGPSQTPVLKLREGKWVTMIGGAVGKTEFLGAVTITLDTLVFRDSLRRQLMDGLSIGFFDDRGLIWSKLGNQSVLTEALKPNTDSFLAKTPGTEKPPNKTVQLSNGTHLVSVFPILGYKRTSTLRSQEGERWYLAVLEPVSLSPGLRAFQFVLAAIVLLSSFAAVWISAITARRITRPIEKVSRATAAIAKGGAGLELVVKTGDEVEDLANAVSNMNADLQLYQQQLVESARLAAMGEMTSEISHEIQNRISGISLWLQHLDSEVSEGDERREYIDEMKLGLAGFNDMLAGLKEYYRKPALKLTEFDLVEFVEESVLYAAEKAADNGISISFENSAQATVITADRDKLQGVLLNLLINAIEASPGNGKVRIRSSDDTTQLLLSVEDEGAGIPEGEREKVFYPFYTTKSSGSGLGLAISRNVVLAHSGNVRIKDRAEGGSVFEVVLPSVRN